MSHLSLSERRMSVVTVENVSVILTIEQIEEIEIRTTTDMQLLTTVPV